MSTSVNNYDIIQVTGLYIPWSKKLKSTVLKGPADYDIEQVDPTDCSIRVYKFFCYMHLNPICVPAIHFLI